MESDPRLLSRRRLLVAGGVVGATGAAATWAVLRDDTAAPASAESQPSHSGHHGSASPDTSPQPVVAGLPDARWSDPATWGGSVPGRGDKAVLSQPVLLDVDATVAGVLIESGASLVFDPSQSLTLSTTENVIVEGRLDARPTDASVVHTVEFLDVDETRFVGSHAEGSLDTDVGLWVVRGGALDLHGTRKTAWTRLASAARRGDTVIEVDDASGWQPGDEVVVTPTEPTTNEDHYLHHDRRTITDVSGSRVTLDDELDHSHLPVTLRQGMTHRAEVLNLTRNVRIQGTPDGHAHVILLDLTEPQTIEYAGLQHLGPRQRDEEVLGRYALHFHMNEEGSRGSVVEGTVVYDSPAHAFVAHLSNGVTFRDCISHDTVDDAYWWDLGLEGGRDQVPSDDITYERCVAHLVTSGGNSRFNLTGFMLGAGAGNVARECVAVGIEGGAESSAGFHWPSHSRDDNMWTFEDCTAHNNKHSGIYYWQNGAPRTIVDRFTGFHLQQGVFAGSYTNLVSYRDCTLYACKKAGLVVSAVPSKEGKRTDETITYEGMYVDQAGLSEYAVYVTKHLAKGADDRITIFSGGQFMGGTVAQVGFPEPGNNLQLYEFVDCSFEGNEFWLADGVPGPSELQVRTTSGDTFVVRPADQPGDPRPEWNASVSRR